MDYRKPGVAGKTWCLSNSPFTLSAFLICANPSPPAFPPKMVYRRKRAGRPSYRYARGGRSFRGSYSRGRFVSSRRRYGGGRTGSVRLAPTRGLGGGSALSTTNNQIRVYEQQLTADLVITNGFAPGVDSSTVQALYWYTTTPTLLIPTDKRLEHHFALSQSFRIKCIEFTVSPCQTISNGAALNTQGQVILCPLHSQGDIVASGVAGYTISQTNADRWAEMNHAKVLKTRNGQLEAATMKVSQSVFEYNFVDITFGTAGSVSTGRPQFTGRNWYSTRDYDGGSETYSQMLHYGFCIVIAGFDTPTTFQNLRVQRRITWEFKGLDPNSEVVTLLPLTKFLSLKEMHESKLPRSQKVLHDSGAIIWDPVAKEYKSVSMEDYKASRPSVPAVDPWTDEDPYREFDEEDEEKMAALALVDVPKSAPKRSASRQPSPSPSTIKRGFTNMKM